MDKAVEYLEDEFNTEWRSSGKSVIRHQDLSTDNTEIIETYTIMRMLPYHGGGAYNNLMFDLKDDIKEGYTSTIVPMEPIPSIPSSIKEWEENVGENYREYCAFNGIPYEL